jgi:hypothetical protein
MARVDLATIKAWSEASKLNIQTIDNELLNQLEEEVLGRIGGTYDTSVWTTSSNTPLLIRTIFAKLYVSWFYNRAYSEDNDTPNIYAGKLGENAEMLVQGILDGSIVVPGTTSPTGGNPSFFPNDASSSMDPRDFPEDPSVGPAKFSMNQAF